VHPGSWAGSCTATGPSVYTVRVDSFTLLATGLRIVGAERREVSLLHLRNKPLPARKRAYKGQQSRYRKHSCTRMTEMSEPLQNCSQTPLRVMDRLFTAERTLPNPGPWPPVSDKTVRNGQKHTIRPSNLPRKSRMSRKSKRSESTESHKSLASLVSFRRFVHSEVSALKVCRECAPLCASRMSNSETGDGQHGCLPPVYEPCWAGMSESENPATYETLANSETGRDKEAALGP